MPGCSQDRVDRDLVALHDVEDAVRKPGFLEQLGGEDRRGRVLLRRLEDERVPAGDRRRPHPHGHHRGEVERSDARHDAERLADRVDVDAGRGLLRVVALQELRDPADVLDDLDAALHLAERVGQDLPVLRREADARGPRDARRRAGRCGRRARRASRATSGATSSGRPWQRRPRGRCRRSTRSRPHRTARPWPGCTPALFARIRRGWPRRRSSGRSSVAQSSPLLPCRPPNSACSSS